MASVDIRDVRKAFGSTQILHGVSVPIADGEFVVLVGPSGCGKSTLLRMIAGLENISGGEIAIGGRVVNNVPPKERDIAMVFQNYALYPHMTVADNMGFSLKLRKTAQAEINGKVKRAAEILNLGALLERYPRQLSGGQRQRVAIARAIARRPSFVVADEPVSALDMTIQKQILKLVRELQERYGFACLFVSHDLGAVEQVADRVAVMEEGRIVEIGSRDDIFDRPRHAYTKRLLEAAMLLERSFAPAAATPQPAA